jgi:hypothetical protein
VTVALVLAAVSVPLFFGPVAYFAWCVLHPADEPAEQDTDPFEAVEQVTWDFGCGWRNA